jgi:alkanesulfonate monooxygenase SsuD/methylene tetrahydromethanopterin reductase-like flavin-dependent oxidoreductase (luciferase family)
VMQLPVHHPIHIAEAGAVIDNLSGGRFILGCGLGQRDRSAFGVAPGGIASRFEESIEIIRRAWREERFSFTGEHFKFDNVRVSPRPATAGGPPIWVGAISKAGLLRAGRIGDGWPTDNLQSLETMREWAAIYRQSAARHGNKAEVVLARSAWVSTNRAEVIEKWWPIIKAFHQPYIRIGLFKDIGPEPGDWSFDRVVTDRLIAGTPDEVAAQIDRCRQQTGCEWLILMFRHPHGPPNEDVLRCIELFGKEVMPRFKS